MTKRFKSQLAFWRSGFAILLLAILSVFGGSLLSPVKLTAASSCTTTLSAGANLGTALTTAKSGDTICLNTGNYPAFFANGAVHTSYVTVQPAPGAQPVLSGQGRLADSSFIRFQNLSITNHLDVQDGSSGNSHDIQFIDNNITGTSGPHIYGTLIENVLFQGNYFHDIDAPGACAPGGSAGSNGQAISLGGADNVVILNNTFKSIGWHYIQGGGVVGGRGITVDGNLFEGPAPADDIACAHLNVWQIWSGGANDTFKNNIVSDAYGQSNVDAIMFETGAAGGAGGCVGMSNTTISNNLFIGGAGGTFGEVLDTTGVTITNNTVVSGTYGMWAVRACTGPGGAPTTNANISRNIVVSQTNQYGTCPTGGNCYPDFTYGLGTCKSNCAADYNVSQDGTAASNFSGLTTHYVTNWTPKWVTTSWNPATSATPPAGYYQPVGLPFAAGWSPTGATPPPPPTSTPAPTATSTPTGTPTAAPTATPKPTPTPTPTSTPPQATSIFPSSGITGTVDWNDHSAVELGLKFRSDVARQVTGVRFYKSAKNTGAHTGSLWTTGGKRLATVTFTSESASGWQTAKFSTPVSIAANTTYVVSYHTTTGHYSAASEYFANSGANDGTLHALSNAAAGGNGVFVYGASAFPHQSYKATNYWVDVVVSASGNASLSAAAAAAHLSGGSVLPLVLVFFLSGVVVACTSIGRRLGPLTIKN
jgi:hypothetical protein